MLDVNVTMSTLEIMLLIYCLPRNVTLVPDDNDTDYEGITSDFIHRARRLPRVVCCFYEDLFQDMLETLRESLIYIEKATVKLLPN